MAHQAARSISLIRLAEFAALIKRFGSSAERGGLS